MTTRFLSPRACLLHQPPLVRRQASAAAVCLLVLAAGGCTKHNAAPVPPVPVRIKVLTPEEITVSRRFSGSVEPLQSTTLAFKLAGTVRSLYRPPGTGRDVQVGDTLAKGIVIAELDEGDLRRAKASAQAKVAQLETRVSTAKDNSAIATRNYQRYVNAPPGTASKMELDDADARRITAAGELASAENALTEARVALDQAIDNYDNRQLVVPFDNATVAEKSIEPGERKAAHEVAFRLIDISTVHVNFGVPDTIIGQPALDPDRAQHVFLGQKLPVTADAFEGRTLIGTVTKIAPQADPRTRSFLTQLSITNQETAPGQPLLRPGMIVSVRVGAQQDRKVMLVPMAAIHQGHSADELMVYEAVSEDGHDRVRARKVALGGVYNNQVEILADRSQVRAGSRVVVTTAERLSDGAMVRVMKDDSGTAAALTEAQ